MVYSQNHYQALTLPGGLRWILPVSGNGHDGHLKSPIDDIQLRSWGIEPVDGRMPGFAAIVGCARSNKVAVKIVREAAETQYPDFPVRECQRSKHHPSAAGRRL